MTQITLPQHIEDELVPFVERQINMEKGFYELVETLPNFNDKEVMLANSKAFLSSLHQRLAYLEQLKNN